MEQPFSVSVNCSSFFFRFFLRSFFLAGAYYGRFCFLLFGLFFLRRVLGDEIELIIFDLDSQQADIGECALEDVF